MGAGGEEFGLALYRGKGGLTRMLEANDPRAIDSLAVTFDEDPHWAAEAAIALVPTIAGVPDPMKVERKGIGFPEPRGLLQRWSMRRAHALYGVRYEIDTCRSVPAAVTCTVA